MSDAMFAALCGALFGVSAIALVLVVARFKVPAGHPLHGIALGAMLVQHALLWTTLVVWAVLR